MAFLDENGLAYYHGKIDDIFAHKDGSYSTLTAGNAEQLVSTVGVEESTPYLFRTTGGSADVGDRVRLSEIVGGTVAWNQLATIPYSDTSKTENGVTITDNRGGSFTVSTDANGATADTYLVTSTVPVIKDHKYFFKAAPAGGSVSTYYAYMTQSGVVENKTDLGNGCMQNCLSNGTAYIVGVYVKNGAIISTPIRFIPQLFDLTAMFGSTIADYLYTLESGTAGAGVAKLKSWGFCTKPYYAYNAGSLLSVKTSAHKEIGFNQWDEQWELGTWGVGATGVVSQIASSTQIRNKNLIPVLPNTQYEINTATDTSGFYIALISDDGSPMLGVGIARESGSTSKKFTTKADTHWLGFSMAASYGTTYKNDICLHLVWDGEMDGQYAPYSENTYPLDSDLELRGIPMLDANNSLYYDGDVYPASGDVTRRFGTVELGSKSWTAKSLSNSRTAFYTDYTAWDDAPLSNPDIATPSLISQYGFSIIRQTASSWGTNTMLFNTITGTLPAAMFAIIVPDSMFVDAAAFKTAMDGVYLVYELKTATTESAEPYQETQVCNDFGTEEFIDSRTVPMPVGYNAFYQANLRAKLEMAPDSPSGNGDYIVRQTDGLNEYVLLEKELPTLPSTDGTYALKCTVADGTATLSWVADE